MDPRGEASSARELFSGLGDRAWLNCAHQAPLPDAAVAAVREALEDKRSPWRIEDGDFVAVPRRLRSALGRLIGAPAEEVILANSTSYGIELLARTFPWKRGDEVLLVDGDFPATVYPWLPLRGRNVNVRVLRPEGGHLTAEQLAAELSSSTRVFCCSWVFSFSGGTVDLEALGSVCRERDVAFVVNGSQAVGSRPIDVAETPIDALSCAGFKWLCGPYATGLDTPPGSRAAPSLPADPPHEHVEVSTGDDDSLGPLAPASCNLWGRTPGVEGSEKGYPLRTPWRLAEQGGGVKQIGDQPALAPQDVIGEINQALGLSHQRSQIASAESEDPVPSSILETEQRA